MQFKDYQLKKRPLIESRLIEYFGSKKKDNIPQLFKKQKIIESLEKFALSGKLIRGTLFLFACEMFGKRINNGIIDIACAIELMHSALLIHDDIIDNDTVRRGNKTIFAQYKDYGELIHAKDPNHYGVSIGTIVGDIALFFAMELLSSHSDKTLSQLLKYYSKEIYLVALAESVDSEFGQVDKEATMSEIYDIYKYKTARYTFSLSFVLAGIIAKSDNATIQKLDKIGELAGIIFQLKDDELGLLGDEETIGKIVGSDIRENKKTIIRHLLFQKAKGKDREFLDEIFGNEQITSEEIDRLRLIICKYQIIEEHGKIIENFMANIWDNFEELDVNKNYKEILRDLLIYNLKRTY